MMSVDDFSLSAYDFDLPQDLLAKRPASPRDHSRLLVFDVESQTLSHHFFYELPSLLPQGSDLFFNQTKVVPCRLEASKLSGGKAEIFVLDPTAQGPHYQAWIKTSGKKKCGDQFKIDDFQIEITEIMGDGRFLIIEKNNSLSELLQKRAQIPIPPYIRKGVADSQDLQDYQTVYAQIEGSVAAPTAGLHFTKNVLSELSEKNMGIHFLTLHVGAGTFSPVQESSIVNHRMHEEVFHLNQNTWNCFQQSHNPIAVGTTSLRCLESAARMGDRFQPDIEHKTSLFLYPGQGPRHIHSLLTNFHLPQSSLLMLVSSLIGRQKTLEIYQQAIEKKYRFFSYGDAMLILGKPR